jgi:hypothetical protein
MAQWDPFMYWTVAEGGAQFGSAMPAFKDALSKDDIWAVIAYRGAALRRCVRPNAGGAARFNTSAQHLLGRLFVCCARGARFTLSKAPV